MFKDGRLREVELAFLNAPFDPEGWPSALEQLAALTGSKLAQLCGGGTGPELDFNFFSGDCHDPNGHLTNPMLYGPENWRINCAQSARTIQDERHYAAYRETRPSAYYDDAVSDLDLPFGCQTALMLDSNGLLGLALLRSSRNGHCTAETLHCFRLIARQAHRAIRAQIALGEETAELMVAGVTGHRECTILLDRFGNVLAMTAAAEHLFEQPGGLSMRGLRLALAHSGEEHALYAAFKRLLADDGIGGPMIHDTVIGRSSARPGGRWRAVLVRLPGSPERLSFAPSLALTLKPLAV